MSRAFPADARVMSLHMASQFGMEGLWLPFALIAAWLVQSLPLDALRWVVLAVVIYSAISLLRAALTRRHALC